MGLDMQLYRKRYTKNWSYLGSRFEVRLKKDGGNVPLKNPVAVTEELMVWRKANAIHNFFVNECYFSDETDSSPVMMRALPDDLRELKRRADKILETVKLVEGKIKNGFTLTEKGEKLDMWIDGEHIADEAHLKLCRELLPTVDGYFFGSQEYDQFYVEDLQDTQDMLSELMADTEWDTADYDYEYHADW